MSTDYFGIGSDGKPVIGRALIGEAPCGHVNFVAAWDGGRCMDDGEVLQLLEDGYAFRLVPIEQARETVAFCDCR